MSVGVKVKWCRTKTKNPTEKVTNGTSATIYVTAYKRFVLHKKLILKMKKKQRTNQPKFNFVFLLVIYFRIFTPTPSRSFCDWCLATAFGHIGFFFQLDCWRLGGTMARCLRRFLPINSWLGGWLLGTNTR